MDKNLSKIGKILISERIALDTVFHFEQVFFFCSLLNKNVLEWFLIIICKGHTLTISTNPFSRNHPTLFFDEGEKVGRCPILNSYFTKLTKTANEDVLKKTILKNFSISTRKHLYQSLVFIKLQTFRPATLLKRDSNKGVFLLQNFQEYPF